MLRWRNLKTTFRCKPRSSNDFGKARLYRRMWMQTLRTKERIPDRHYHAWERRRYQGPVR